VRDTAAASLFGRLKAFMETRFDKTPVIGPNDVMCTTDFIPLADLHKMMCEEGIIIAVTDLKKQLESAAMGYAVRPIHRTVYNEAGGSEHKNVQNAVMVRKKVVEGNEGGAGTGGEDWDDE
jgi:hypothetical protein